MHLLFVWNRQALQRIVHECDRRIVRVVCEGARLHDTAYCAVRPFWYDDIDVRILEVVLKGLDACGIIEADSMQAWLAVELGIALQSLVHEAFTVGMQIVRPTIVPHTYEMLGVIQINIASELLCRRPGRWSCEIPSHNFFMVTAIARRHGDILWQDERLRHALVIAADHPA